MSKAGSAAKVKLNSFDDLFGASDMTAGTDQVQEIPLSELYEFKGHPFKVLDEKDAGNSGEHQKLWCTYARYCKTKGRGRL